MLHDDRAADGNVQLVERDDVVGRVEDAVGAGVADVPRPLLRPDLDGERMVLGARELPQHLVEIDVASRTSSVPSTPKKMTAVMTAVKMQVAAADAVLVAGAVAPLRGA